MAAQGDRSKLAPRAASPSKRETKTATEKITVYVATCQIPSFDADTAASQPVFKPVKFQTLVSPTGTLADLRFFLMSQWQISKSPFAQLPIEEQFYTFKGRILRLDGTLEGYYISNNDTVYIRFSSFGKIHDPWAMSTSELRAELKARNAYETKLQPEQLMMRLVEQIMKESRMQRLQLATKREQKDQVVAITKELERFQGHSDSKTRHEVHVSQRADVLFPRPASLQWPHPPTNHRTVFLSIAQLERTYQAIPRDVLDPGIFLFDAERKWVFDKHNVLQKASFDYKYICFDDDFLELLTLKEEMGLVFWFRPQTSYEKLSAFIESIDDPVTQAKYIPLILKESKWLTLCGINGWEGKVRNDGRKRDTSKVPQFTKSISRITTNLASKSFDYLAVQEILYQANPTLLFAPL